MTPGRPPLGAKIVQHLDADSETKQRLEILLQTVSGELAVADACQTLGISQARFFELRSQMLQAAIDGLRPRPAGRPPHSIDPAAERIQELEQEVQELRVHLTAAQLREEIALIMPGALARNQRAGKKTAQRTAGPPNPRPRPSRPESDPSTDARCDT